MGSHVTLQGWLRIKTNKTSFSCVKHNYNSTHVEDQKWTRLVVYRTRHMVSAILSTFRNVLHK
jgi:ribosomal 30S subunit maturation factor RimM